MKYIRHFINLPNSLVCVDKESYALRWKFA